MEHYYLLSVEQIERMIKETSDVQDSLKCKSQVLEMKIVVLQYVKALLESSISAEEVFEYAFNKGAKWEHGEWAENKPIATLEEFINSKTNP